MIFSNQITFIQLLSNITIFMFAIKEKQVHQCVRLIFQTLRDVPKKIMETYAETKKEMVSRLAGYVQLDASLQMDDHGA